jgi:hypothetical protein
MSNEEYPPFKRIEKYLSPKTWPGSFMDAVNHAKASSLPESLLCGYQRFHHALRQGNQRNGVVPSYDSALAALRRKGEVELADRTESLINRVLMKPDPQQLLFRASLLADMKTFDGLLEAAAVRLRKWSYHQEAAEIVKIREAYRESGLKAHIENYASPPARENGK